MWGFKWYKFRKIATKYLVSTVWKRGTLFWTREDGRFFDSEIRFRVFDSCPQICQFAWLEGIHSKWEVTYHKALGVPPPSLPSFPLPPPLSPSFPLPPPPSLLPPPSMETFLIGPLPLAPNAKDVMNLLKKLHEWHILFINMTSCIWSNFDVFRSSSVFVILIQHVTWWSFVTNMLRNQMYSNCTLSTGWQKGSRINPLLGKKGNRTLGSFIELYCKWWCCGNLNFRVTCNASWMLWPLSLQT